MSGDDAPDGYLIPKHVADDLVRAIESGETEFGGVVPLGEPDPPSVLPQVVWPPEGRTWVCHHGLAEEFGWRSLSGIGERCTLCSRTELEDVAEQVVRGWEGTHHLCALQVLHLAKLLAEAWEALGVTPDEARMRAVA